MITTKRRAGGAVLVSGAAAAALAGAIFGSGAGFGAGAEAGPSRSDLPIDAVSWATLHDRVDPVPTAPFRRATAHDSRRAPASPTAPATFPPAGPDWPSPAKPETDGALHAAGRVVARLTSRGAGLFGGALP